MSDPKSALDPDIIHSLITTAFTMRERAYAPYSNFQVGAALLTSHGTIIGGCNVENASYGAGICAERTAISKAVSEGHTKVTAVAVTSHLPTPISPCGLCRQVLREFLPLSAPVYMVASSYPSPSTSPPAWLSTEGFGEGGKGIVEVRTLEELLPLSFGPEQLAMKR